MGGPPHPHCQEGLWSPLGLRWEDRLSEPLLRAQWHHVTRPLTPIRGTPSPLPQWKLAANEAPEGPRVRQPPPSSAPSQPSGPPSLVCVVGKADLFILLCPPTSCHCWGLEGTAGESGQLSRMILFVYLVAFRGLDSGWFPNLSYSPDKCVTKSFFLSAKEFLFLLMYLGTVEFFLFLCLGPPSNTQGLLPAA